MVHLQKPPYPVIYLYESQDFDLKTRVYILMRINVVPVEYATLDQMFHLIMCFFQSAADINFIWNGVLWWFVGICVCIGIWNSLRLYRLPVYPVNWFSDLRFYKIPLDLVKWYHWRGNIKFRECRSKDTTLEIESWVPKILCSSYWRESKILS